MKYLHFIPVVNRLDLLRLALDSVRCFWPFTTIIDNTAEGLAASDWPCRVLRPSVPLFIFQAMNLMQRESLAAHCDAWGYQHNDAEAEGDTALRFLAAVDHLSRSSRNWGVLFTHYDILSAYRTAAVQRVGAWDSNFPAYFGDNDWFRRLRLAGFEAVESSLPVKHHNGASSTIKSDQIRNEANRHFFPASENYYAAKWGGKPGKEKFTVPFGGKMT